MIFKTFDDGKIDKWTAKIGIFGKSFNELGTAINNAFQSTINNIDNFDNDIGFWESLKDNLFPKKEDIQSKMIDVDALIPEIDDNTAQGILGTIREIEGGVHSEYKTFQELYDTGDKQNQWIAEYAQNTKGQIRSTEGVIQANQQARESAIAYNNGLKQMTFGAKAANVAMKGLAIAGNMLLMWGISEAISALYKFSQVSKDVANSAQEIGSSFKETKKDIASYKEKVEELRGVINNSSSSVSEVTQARKDLMAVQDELIEKFGTEKESINAITEVINGQAGAWEKLTSKKWQEAKNEFNGKGGIIKDVSNLTKGYGDNIERMQDEYGNYEETIDLGSISGNENRQKAEELLKKFGEFSKTSAGIGQIKISGNATEVYEKILAIQETLDKMDVDFGKSFDKNLTDKANKVRKGFI